MRISDLKQMMEIEDMSQVPLKEGDKFLTGRQIIAQKEHKVAGDVVSFYVVTYADENGKNISYKPVYEKLEE